MNDVKLENTLIFFDDISFFLNFMTVLNLKD